MGIGNSRRTDGIAGSVVARPILKPAAHPPLEEWQGWHRAGSVFIHTPTFEYTHVDKMTLYTRDSLSRAISRT
jgi:hypothetical protein